MIPYKKRPHGRREAVRAEKKGLSWKIGKYAVYFFMNQVLM